MHRTRFAFVPLALLVATTAACSPPQAKSPGADVPILPLKSVRLYEAGVGYFEREGMAGSRTSLPVPPGHLDDALKTLVVLSKGGKAEVSGVSFPSSITPGMARSLAGLPATEGSPLTFRALLATMRGAQVVVTSTDGHTLQGRLVDVVDGPRNNRGEKPKDEKKTDDATKVEAAKDEGNLVALVLADSGDLTRFAESQIASVRPTDPAFITRLGTALDAVSTQGARNPRLVEVLGDGHEPVTLGYLAEAPIWRTTYRLVLGDDGKAFLQGWALVHNDTDENWKSVHVELVNGQPDSFLFPMAAPRYGRRELKTPDNLASTVPQLLDNSPDRMWGDHIEDASEAGGLALSGSGEGGGGRGEGIGLGSVGTLGHGSGSGGGYGYSVGSGHGASGQSSLLDVGNLAKTAQAEAIEGGTLFRYVLKNGLDLAARSSALVPFVSAPLESTAISYVDDLSNGARAGVRFVNQTKQTLPPGVIAFFADGGFAGESALDRLRPGERRFLTFGNDLDVDVSRKNVKSSDASQKVLFSHGALEEHYLRTVKSDYVVKNDSGRARHVVIAFHIANNAKIEGFDRVDFDAERNLPLGVVDLAPKKNLSRAVTTTEGLVTRTPSDQLETTKLDRLSHEAALSPFEQKVLAEAAGRAKPHEAAKETKRLAHEEVQKAEGELARLKENLKTLTTEKDKTHPFVVRVVAAEDRLAKAKLAEEAAAKEVTKRSDELTQVLEKLTPH
jgi:hypothetical protein